METITAILIGLPSALLFGGLVVRIADKVANY
jgi:hypothetical protein